MSSSRLDSLSIKDARALVLAAQGFDKPRTKTKSTTADAVALIKKLGVVQIDSVNVLVRSQELPLFSRLGDHDRNAIPKATSQGKIFEYWGHEAAHLPVELHPMFRFKMHAASVIVRYMLKPKYLLTSLSMVIGICTFPGAAALAIVGGSYDRGTLSPFVLVSMSGTLGSHRPINTCSGTVIAPTWVLTAKHCIANWNEVLSYRPEQVHIKVASTGDTFLSYSASRLVPLKKYDLALVETTETIEGVNVVRYGKVPTASTWTYRVYGYGVTESHTLGNRPESSTVLKFLDVVLDRRYLWGAIDFSSPEGSACFGDSGGAIMATNPESGVQLLVAVVSGGQTLGDLYCAPRAKTTANTVDNTLSEISKYVGVVAVGSSFDDTQIVVTQSNIAETICDKDWLQSQAVSFKEIKQSALSTGVNKTQTHTPMLNIPVLLGGTLDNSSAIWVKKTGKYSVQHKRLLDLTLNAMVCSDTITLADATAAFSGKWSLAYDRYVR